MIFISFCWQPKMTVDFLICKWHCGRTLFTITETCFLSKNMKYLIYWVQKFLPKQWSTALIFLQIYKVRSESFMKIGLSVFEKTCQEKKKMIIEEKKHSSNKKIFRWTWKTFINLAWSTSLSTSFTV